MPAVLSGLAVRDAGAIVAEESDEKKGRWTERAAVL
jgi:hypothetical protein